MEEGNPTSTGGIKAAIHLRDVLGYKLFAEKPRDKYERGWGVDCLGAKEIMCSWTLSIQDINNNVTHLTFDLTDDDSPLTIGMDVKLYYVTDNLSSQSNLRFNRPFDNGPRIFYTYVTGDDKFNRRLRLAITPIIPIVPSLLDNTEPQKQQRMNTLAKRLHRLTHESSDELYRFCTQAGYDITNMKGALDDICNSCEVCAFSGLSSFSKQISISHINQAFNQEIQIDFTYCQIRCQQ